MLYVQAIEAKAGSAFEIPVTEAWERHDVYVTALVFRGGSAPSKITPARAVGVAHVPMDRRDRRVAVGLSAPKQMRPERPLQVTVSAPQLAGKEAYATVSAVDVGILNITRFAVPDAPKHFFAQRRLGVDAYDVYGRVIESFEGESARLRFGGDMPLEALPQARRPTARVQTVDLFAGPVKLDAKGIARIEVPVPDFNGTLRVSALVFAADRYGNRDAETVVRAPIVAEASMPRVMAPGDRSTVTLDITNFTGKPGDFKVQVDGIGPVSIGEGAKTAKLGVRGQVDAQLPADRHRRLHRRAGAGARRRQRFQGRPQIRPAGAPGVAVGAARAHAGARCAGAGLARHRRCRRPDAGFGHRAHERQRAAADPVRQRAAGRARLSLRLRRADHQPRLCRAGARCRYCETARHADARRRQAPCAHGRRVRAPDRDAGLVRAFLDVGRRRLRQSGADAVHRRVSARCARGRLRGARRGAAEGAAAAQRGSARRRQRVLRPGSSFDT